MFWCVSFPSARSLLNTAPVQPSVGANMNHTSATLLYSAYSLMGDFAMGHLSNMKESLGLDTRVALVYGDAEYIQLCNLFGGEALSLAVKWPHGDDFLSPPLSQPHC